MKFTMVTMRSLWFFLAAMCGSVAGFSQEELMLEEAVSAHSYFGSFSRSMSFEGYGSGGYGDATQTKFNLRVCASHEQPGENCTSAYPEQGQLEWRFIRNLGWRKFSKYGSARKDWWDFKKTIRWPFNRYGTFGYNWWDGN